MAERYIGFYWTLPVNIAGFRSIPENVEKAAKASKTIRYQMERCRRWIEDNHDTRLVGEHVFIELSPDRGTEFIVEKLKALRRIYKDEDVAVIYVRFSDVKNWRTHFRMYEFIETHFAHSQPLPPDEIIIDGRIFNPIIHFEDSRARYERDISRLRGTWLGELHLSWSRYRSIRGWPKLVAADLNSLGIRTKTGRVWSADNVTKQVTRFGRTWIVHQSNEETSFEADGP
jgi:hypothetical protein